MRALSQYSEKAMKSRNTADDERGFQTIEKEGKIPIMSTNVAITGMPR